MEHCCRNNGEVSLYHLHQYFVKYLHRHFDVSVEDFEALLDLPMAWNTGQYFPMWEKLPRINL